MTTGQKELPAGWKWVKLGEVLTPIKGRKPAKISELEFHGCLRHLLISDLHGNGVITFASDPSGVEAFEDDILIAWDGANAGTTNYGLSGLVGSTLAVLRKTQAHIHTPFLGSFLKSKFKQLNVDFTSGATIPHIQRNLLLNMPIPLPPLEEQKRIADILNKAEEIKKLREEADKKTEELIPAIFHEMFGCPTCKENLVNGHIGDHGDIVSGVTKNNRLQNDSMVEVPYLRVANVQDGYLDLSEIKTILASPSNIQKYQLLKGDILLTEGGDNDKLGRGTIWSDEIPNCIHQNHVFRIRLNRIELLPEFISNYLTTPSAKAYFLREAKQTTNLASINLKAVRGLPIHIPPIELQEQFVYRVGAIEELKSTQAYSRFELNRTKSSLLQRAFRGEL